MHLHHLAAETLQGYEIAPLNPAKELYQPHLTLAGISWQPSESLLISSFIDDLIAMPTLPFHLALGRGDDMGQYLESFYETQN